MDDIFQKNTQNIEKITDIILNYMGELPITPEPKRKYPMDSLIINRKRYIKKKDPLSRVRFKKELQKNLQFTLKFCERCYGPTDTLYTCMKCFVHVCAKCSLVKNVTRCMECADL